MVDKALEDVVKMATLLYIYAGCSFRSVARSVEVINFVFPSLGLVKVSHVSVRDWVLKIGLDMYRGHIGYHPVVALYHSTLSLGYLQRYDNPENRLDGLLAEYCN